jgi:hypothetical protein
MFLVGRTGATMEFGPKYKIERQGVNPNPRCEDDYHRQRCLERELVVNGGFRFRMCSGILFPLEIRSPASNAAGILA